MIITVINLNIFYADIEDIEIINEDLNKINSFNELKFFLEDNYCYPIEDQKWNIKNIDLSEYDLESQLFLDYLNNNDNITLYIEDNKYNIYIKYYKYDDNNELKEKIFEIENVTSQTEISELYVIFSITYNINIQNLNILFNNNLLKMEFNLAYIKLKKIIYLN